MSGNGLKSAKLLSGSWKWVDYADGSGHIENSNGESVISYDYVTQEYKDMNGKWRFMDYYPDFTPWDKFKMDIENLIVSEGLDEYNDTVKSIAELERKLHIIDDYSLFKNGLFRSWECYDNVEEVQDTLSNYLIAGNTPDVFDLSIADRLCDIYGVIYTCLELTDNQKELVVIGVECEQDWSNIVSPNLKMLYDAIINEQSEYENQEMQM